MVRSMHSRDEKERQLDVNTTDDEMQIETFHYEPATPAAKRKGVKRVAAYCRVSTLMEDQELSFETQSDYYGNLIGNDPEMTLVGIYGDQGFSGLRAEKRREFMRMIQDCMDGKIDVVMVKSISRFSRNMVECMDFINRLKEKSIAVIFEKEGINTLDEQSGMILSIYASMAQNESCSQSENLRWAQRCRAEMGNPIRGACYGYRVERKPGDPFRYWIVHEEEARRIRYIFSLAYQGYTTIEIMRMANALEEQLGGRDRWSIARIQAALQREAYKGDLLTGKRITMDFLSKKVLKNEGQHEQFYIEKHHPAIISRRVFDAVESYYSNGFLNSRKQELRRVWFEEHPEILERRVQGVDVGATDEDQDNSSGNNTLGDGSLDADASWKGEC